MVRTILGDLIDEAREAVNRSAEVGGNEQELRELRNAVRLVIGAVERLEERRHGSD